MLLQVRLLRDNRQFWRAAPWLALLLLLNGCGPDPKATDPSSEIFDKHHKNLRMHFRQLGDGREVESEVVAGIPSRIPRLNPGMAPEVVFRELGFSSASVPMWSYGRGPPSGYRIYYELRTNCYLGLGFDMLAEPPTLRGAWIEGDGWKGFTNSVSDAAN